MSSNETKKAMMSVEIAMPIMPAIDQQQEAVELAARRAPRGEIRVREHDGEHADGGEQHHGEQREPVEAHHAGKAEDGFTAVQVEPAVRAQPLPEGHGRRAREASAGQPGEDALALDEQIGDEHDERRDRHHKDGQDHGERVVGHHLEQPPGHVDQTLPARVRERSATTA